MEIKIAEYSGYCFGVKKALKLTEETIKKYSSDNRKIFTLGSIINNPGVTKKLAKKGIITVEKAEEIEKNSIFIIRSHGMPPDLVNKIRELKEVEIIDATCPFVKKTQTSANKLAKKGCFVVIIGNKNHPEVLGIKGYVPDKRYMVVEDEKDIENLAYKKKIGVVIQTTQTKEKVSLIVNKLLEKTRELIIYNTICDTTRKRQDSTKKLANNVDVMIIVGGRNSANTTHLAEISRKINSSTYHIESYREIRSEWFKNKRRVGISGGASTPVKDIMKVKETIEKL